MLRLLLPPNLAAAAGRNAIPVKVELDLTSAPPPDLIPALAALQRFGAKPAPVLFLQLTRAQLRELITHLRGLPVFVWVNAPSKPLLWVGPLLRGASEFLQEEEPATPPPPAAGAPVPVAPVRPRANRATPSLSPLVVDGSEHYLALTLPSRESAAYAAALELVKEQGFRLEPSNRKWWLRDRHKVLNFLAGHLGRLREEFHAEFTANFERQTAHLKFAEAAVEVTEAGQAYDVAVQLRAGQAPEGAVAAAVASGRGYIEDQGRIFLVDREQLARLAAAQEALAGERGVSTGVRRVQRIPRARVTEVQELLEEISPQFQPPATWTARSKAMHDLTALPPAPVPAELEVQLRPYQRLGAAWLWYLYHHELGGVLADEMGLGKTLQALAFLSALRRQSPTGACLIVVPASLVENWRREAERFAPMLRVFVHHGDHRLANTAAANQQELIITSYATLARDQTLFAEATLQCVIADEAQHIKNRRSQNARALRAVRARGRFLLTGTPLENSLEDLRSLFEFLMPGFVKPVPAGARAEDRTWYDERLRVQTAPYILRRTKTSVAPELPEKIEQVLYCDLEPAQAALYRRVQEESERALLELETKGASEAAVRLATLTQLLRLRQVCCDPRLVQANPSPGDGDGAVASTKLEAFRELLAEVIDEGHRMLVFSQFTSLLALLRQELEEQQIPYAYLDGSMPPRARQAEVDRFQADDQLPIFLLSLKAGGTGLNLTGADTVLHFDPWWNPAVEAQATDRAHRIGQTRAVTSYKLICSGTVEEKVLGLQENKRQLLADVFEASDAAAARLGLADLRSLLRA